MLLDTTWIQMFAVDCYIHGVVLQQLDSSLSLLLWIGPRSWPAKEIVNNEVWESYLVHRGLIMRILRSVFGPRLWNHSSGWDWSYGALLIIVDSDVVGEIFHDWWGLLEVVIDLWCRLQSFLIFLLIGRLKKIDLCRNDLTLSWIIYRYWFGSVLSVATFNSTLGMTISRGQIRRFYLRQLCWTYRFAIRNLNTLAFDRHILRHHFLLITIPRLIFQHLLLLFLLQV